MFDKLVEVIIQFIDLFRFFFVVKQWQDGVVLRFGRYHRDAHPGFHWMLPFRMEYVCWCNVVPETASVGPQSLTTRDEQSVIVGAVLTYGISNVKTFLLEVEGAHDVVCDSAYGVIADYVMGRTWDELRNMNLANELTKKVRVLAKRYGVEILNVQLTDFTRSRSLRLVTQTARNSHI